MELDLGTKEGVLASCCSRPRIARDRTIDIDFIMVQCDLCVKACLALIYSNNRTVVSGNTLRDFFPGPIKKRRG
jgi:hypothetical protein